MPWSFIPINPLISLILNDFALLFIRTYIDPLTAAHSPAITTAKGKTDKERKEEEEKKGLSTSLSQAEAFLSSPIHNPSMEKRRLYSKSPGEDHGPEAGTGKEESRRLLIALLKILLETRGSVSEQDCIEFRK